MNQDSNSRFKGAYFKGAYFKGVYIFGPHFIKWGPKLRAVIALAAIAYFMCTFSGCSGRKEYRLVTGNVWTTAYHIRYESSVNLEDSIIYILEGVDSSLSAFNDKSLVSRINRNEQGARADAMLREVMEESKRINTLSGGAFDPTLGPLVDLWGFGRKSPSGHPVNEASVDSVKQFVGISQCYINDRGEMVKKTPYTEFDFSAIAKGYACDLIGRMFLRNGVENFLIEIGGELLGHGVNDRREAWTIMIENPSESEDSASTTPAGLTSLKNEAIATSGSYRRNRMEGAKRISHIINPATGKPTETDVVEATVTAPSCMTADAIATACMVLSADEIEKMAARIPDIKIRIVMTGDRDGDYRIKCFGR